MESLQSPIYPITCSGLSCPGIDMHHHDWIHPWFKFKKNMKQKEVRFSGRVPSTCERVMYSADTNNIFPFYIQATMRGGGDIQRERKTKQTC